MWEEDPDDRPLAGDAAAWLAKISKQHAGTFAVELGSDVQQQSGGGALHGWCTTRLQVVHYTAQQSFGMHHDSSAFQPRLLTAFYYLNR